MDFGNGFDFWKHHSNFASQFNHVRPADKRPGRRFEIAPSTRVPGITSFIAIEGAQEIVLPQPDGPIKSHYHAFGISTRNTLRAWARHRRKLSPATAIFVALKDAAGRFATANFGVISEWMWTSPTKISLAR